MVPVIIIALLSLDQFTKILAVRYLLPQQSVPIIKGIFHLTLVFNRGAAFGIFKNQIPLFILASLVALILIYVNLKNNRYGRFYSISLSLIASGAVGNLIDRLHLGYVIDFMDFRIWPVFNIADSAISIGTVMLAWCLLKPK
ncbi:MAG: signal peptidase II [Candidatus Omnitrophica bacterium]|nr:signal peptidase II [Candidatus Omnitrophota bacterium]